MTEVADQSYLEANNDQSSSETRLERAAKIVSTACGWSAAACFIPLPVVDIVALGAVQANMINNIAELYNQTFEKDVAHNVISVLLSSLIPGSFGSGLKALPGLGTVVGTITFGAFSAASTYALGKVIIRHFEKGGSASSFDVKSVTEDFKKEFSTANKSKTI